MKFLELAASRYSVRKYMDKTIEKEKLDLILEAGRIAPTAGNRQPHRIIVANTSEMLLKIDKCTRCRFGAPVVFIVCYDSAHCWVRPFDQVDSGYVDASIVTTHMMMQAHYLGLGTLWVMHFDAEKTREQFRLPENIIPVAMLVAGYASEDSAPSEKHSQRQDLDKILIQP